MDTWRLVAPFSISSFGEGGVGHTATDSRKDMTWTGGLGRLPRYGVSLPTTMPSLYLPLYSMREEHTIQIIHPCQHLLAGEGRLTGQGWQGSGLRAAPGLRSWPG